MRHKNETNIVDQLKDHVWKTSIMGHAVEIRVIFNSLGLLELTHYREPELTADSPEHNAQFMMIYRQWRDAVIKPDVEKILCAEIDGVVELHTAATIKAGLRKGGVNK